MTASNFDDGETPQRPCTATYVECVAVIEALVGPVGCICRCSRGGGSLGESVVGFAGQKESMKKTADVLVDYDCNTVHETTYPTRGALVWFC